MKKNDKQPLKEIKDKAFYEGLKFKASVLYIKHGASAKEISQQLNVSMPTLQKWNEAGKWSDLRPDTEVLNEYKAADLYICKKLSTGEIAMKLGIKESIVSFWIYANGWDAARQLKQSHSDYKELINEFCSFYTKLFPAHAIEMEVAKNDYLRPVRKLEK